MVVSPHFDDAAMGAGHLLASYPDTTVITVLAGQPPAYPDVPVGVGCPGRIQGRRRRRGRPAPGGPGRHGGARRRTTAGSSSPTISTWPRPIGPRRPTWRRCWPRAIAELDPTSVFVPMGLGNPDHVMVHEAVAPGAPGPARAATWFCYEDHGYKHIPGLLAWRVAKLLRSQPWPTPAIVPHEPDEDRKRRAIWCYTSQIPPLENEHALTARLEGRVPEQFWRLAEPPKGWEGLADLI